MKKKLIKKKRNYKLLISRLIISLWRIKIQQKENVIKISKTWLKRSIGSNLQPCITIIELYTIPKVVINISQSVAKSELINLKLYKTIITTAKIAPRRRAGSTITFIMVYPSERPRGSKRLTRIKAKVIGTITINVPKKILLINPDKDGVI